MRTDVERSVWGVPFWGGWVPAEQSTRNESKHWPDAGKATGLWYTSLNWMFTWRSQYGGITVIVKQMSK